MISSTNVSSSEKVKWLKWLNSFGPSREARKFPPCSVNEEKLLQFLCRALQIMGNCQRPLFNTYIVETVNLTISR